MVLKTGVPQLDNLAMAGAPSIWVASVTAGVAALSLVFFLFQFLNKSEVFPEVLAANTLTGLNFKSGRAPESYHWTKIFQQASKQVISTYHFEILFRVVNTLG